MRYCKTAALFFAILFLAGTLQGCSVLPKQEKNCEEVFTTYYAENSEAIHACMNELRRNFSNTKTLYRFIPRGGNSIQVKQFLSDGAITESHCSDLKCTQQIFDSGVITGIDIRHGQISFHCNYAGLSRGIVHISSGNPEEIYGYNAAMVYQPKGNGWFGRLVDQENTDNTFYYSLIGDNWFYFEICS